MRIWLKGTTDEITVRLTELVEAEVFNDRPRISRDDHSGQSYIEVYGDPIDPTMVVPAIPDKMIDRVTCRERIYKGLRPEGLYKLNGAKLTATTTIRVHSEMRADTIVREEWQDVSIAAPTIDSLVEIYRKFRSGELPPTEDWEAPTVTSDSKVRYFRVDFREGVEAMEAVWANQREMGSYRTPFSLNAVEGVAVIWTEDTSGEELFRLELQERHIEFEERDRQIALH